MPTEDGVLNVVHGVGDIVGEVHDLGFQAFLGGGSPGFSGPGAEPFEDGQIIGVDAKFAVGLAVGSGGGVGAGPGVLAGCVQGRPGQV